MTVAGVAIVNMTIANNETLQYSFQFGVLADTSWSFTNSDLYSDIKTDPAGSPILSLSTLNGKLVVTDPVARIMNFLVGDDALRAALEAGNYFYDLIMVDRSTGATQRLMTGKLTVLEGVTKEP